MKTQTMAISLTVSNEKEASLFLSQNFGFREKYKAKGFSYNLNTSYYFPIIFLTSQSELIENRIKNNIVKGIIIEFIVNDIDYEYERLFEYNCKIKIDELNNKYFDIKYENIIFRLKESTNKIAKINYNNRLIIEKINLYLNVKDANYSANYLSNNFDYPRSGNEVIIDLDEDKSTNIRYFNDKNTEYAQGIIIALIVDDVEDELNNLKKKGISIFVDVTYDPWGEKLFDVIDDNGIVYQPVEWAKPKDNKYHNNSPYLSMNKDISFEKKTYESNPEYIEIIGAKENNLKNISLKIPKKQITVFTGVSGSGKSSIVFDTLAQESGRQLNETYSSFVRLYLPKYKQPNADAILNISPAIVIDQKRLGGNSRSTLGTITDINSLLRVLYSRFALPTLGYANFYSFNDPNGMCLECEGIGKINTLNIDLAIDLEKSLNEGAILLPGYTIGGWYYKSFAHVFDANKKLKDYTKKEMDIFLFGNDRSLDRDVDGINLKYEGLALKFNRQNFQGNKEKADATIKKTEKYITSCTCPSCNGARYNKKVMSSKIAGYTIHDLCQMQIDELIDTLKTFKIPAAYPIVKNLIERLQNLVDIGLEYMPLNRESSTLSGGESQRVKMVKHLSSSLTDVLYIFDEPSIGLHPRDVHRLNELLIKIKNKGNTVIVVEHDPDVIKIADYIVDVGPHAGEHGGQVIYNGDLAGLFEKDTLTAKHLKIKKDIKRDVRISNDYYISSKSTLHNLKNVSLKVPKGVLTVVTGVAGSGKSTLVNNVFAKEFDNIINIDQSSITATHRANPATYIGVLDEIRKIFAKENNVKENLFSANSEGGCPNCKGSGVVEINLSFMEVMEVECEVCNGKKFKEEVFQYTYKNKNILEVMNMTIEESFVFFESKSIKKQLQSLLDVGLSYMTLGQPLNTLSGGECQRLKLATELSSKGNIYILDEPTTGLHMSDINNIIIIINKLIEKGNTVIVIEHNIEMIKQADYIIDMGKEGGTKGGNILFEGTLKELLDCKESITAKYIKDSI